MNIAANRWAAALALGLLTTLCLPSAAKVTAQEADALGKALTPVGAEMAGNKDGTIPAWTGGLTAAPAGATPGNYPDPYAADKPLFSITAETLEHHKGKLTDGQVEMLKKKAGYRMDVYPSRRSAAYPQAIYDAAKKAATTTELKGGGNGYAHAGGATVPFPIPKTAQEVLWNHVTRWRGGGYQRLSSSYPVSPNGDFYRVGYDEVQVYDQNMDESKENRLFQMLLKYTAPATLEGTVYLVWEPIDQVAEQRSGWIYNAGQRRVRRVPDLAYDYVSDASAGLRVTDQFDGYNGAPDRYDWKLLGKQEVYIPYNAYKLLDKKYKAANVLKPGAIARDFARYELHRVWVVEGTLKSGARHIYGKRRFYIDEDSWQVAIEDAYDTRGQLWRHGEHHMAQFYDGQLPWYALNIWYDLNNGAYLTHGLMNEEKKPLTFNVRGKMADFQPDNLRRLGTK